MSMARGRALLTDSEKASLAGEKTEQRRYEARSRFRSRVHENLDEDIQFLLEHDPELLEVLREEVCDTERTEDGVIRFDGIENYGSGKHSVKVKFHRTPGIDSAPVEIHRVRNKNGTNWFDSDVIEAIDAGEFQIQLLSEESSDRNEWLLDAEIASHPLDGDTWEITDIKVIDAEEAWKDDQ